jgi:hypothetical protein
MSNGEKNAARFGCLICPSVILLAGVGTLVKTEVFNTFIIVILLRINK